MTHFNNINIAKKLDAIDNIRQKLQGLTDITFVDEVCCMWCTIRW